MENTVTPNDLYLKQRSQESVNLCQENQCGHEEVPETNQLVLSSSSTDVACQNTGERVCLVEPNDQSELSPFQCSSQDAHELRKAAAEPAEDQFHGQHDSQHVFEHKNTVCEPAMDEPVIKLVPGGQDMSVTNLGYVESDLGDECTLPAVFDKSGVFELPMDPDQDHFSLDKWVLELNKLILAVSSNRGALIALLISARQFCDSYAKLLKDNYDIPYTQLRKQMQKSTKKTQKKLIRLLDPERRSSSKALEQVNQLVQQIESAKQHLEKCLLEDVPVFQIEMPVETKLQDLSKPSSHCCRDFMLCLLFSIAMFFIVWMLLKFCLHGLLQV